MKPRPSFQHGYCSASRRHLSEAPDQWADLQGFYLPQLGYQGITLYDHSLSRVHGPLTGFTLPTAWDVTSGLGRILKFDGTNTFISLGDALKITGPLSIAVWLRLNVNNVLQAILDKGGGSG